MFTSRRYSAVNRHYYPVSDPFYDTFKHIGYLISEEATHDAARNSWRLYAKNGSWVQLNNIEWVNFAEFYMVPTNINYDMRININNDMLNGVILTDVRSIPPQLEINSHLLNKGPYKFVELPKRDFTSKFYIR